MRSRPKDPEKTPAPPRRRGFALFVVMMCLLVVSLLVVSWLKSAAFERQELRAAERRLQADWLAEAAVNRAAAALIKNADYKGETWNISAGELAASDPAAIEIHVAPVADRPQRRTIQITADLSADPLSRIRVTKETIVDLAAENRNPGAAEANPTKSAAGK